MDLQRNDFTKSTELESVTYLALLPPLSYDLQYMLENDGILKA